MILDQDPFLKKKIQIVKLKPLSTQKALKIIYESKSEIEEFHNVIISAPVANQAFYLSGEYFSNGEIEGTLQLLDMAATRVRLKARTMSVRRLKSEDLYQAVSDSLGVPSWRISGERKFYDAIPKKLKERIIGQDEAVERVARVITTREAPFNVNPRMPNGIMLFVGPRGVGKKELIHGLADVLFGDSERISAFDMARFEEPESLWELTGYSDKSKGEVYPSILTRILQKYPLSILFLEEIDKACPDVQRFFAEVFKTGAFEDSLGQRVSLSGVTVVMTVKAYEEKKQQLGFTHDSEIPCDEKAVHEGLASLLDPELMGIIDQVVIFKELRNNELKKIIRRNLIATLREKWDIEWIIGEKLLRFLVDEVKKEKDKLRSLERLFQIHVFSHLALALGRLDLSGRQRVALEFDGKELVVE
ncbi:MAG TPA: ATP-dependent Clp protease ATP-binding subunit [Firmicutes bacterium]|nr:ATP-dependent Clp protease ATP-binding subunit [Bacillota bacterium]